MNITESHLNFYRQKKIPKLGGISDKNTVTIHSLINDNKRPRQHEIHNSNTYNLIKTKHDRYMKSNDYKGFYNAIVELGFRHDVVRSRVLKKLRKPYRNRNLLTL